MKVDSPFEVGDLSNALFPFDSRIWFLQAAASSNILPAICTKAITIILQQEFS